MEAFAVDTWAVATVAGVLGLVLGSFLNVCTLRWPTDGSVVHPPSHCPGSGSPTQWFTNTLLLGIAVSDARFYIIPDQFSLGGTVLGLALAPLPGGLTILAALLGAAVGFGLLWIVARIGTWLFKKDAMGGGDLKMMAMVGAFLGVPGVLLTLFLGALFGSVIFGPISWKTGKLVPFGIFLAGGAAVAYGWGDRLIAWYTVNFLGIY